MRTRRLTLKYHAGCSVPQTFKFTTLVRVKGCTCLDLNLCLNLQLPMQSSMLITRSQHIFNPANAVALVIHRCTDHLRPNEIVLRFQAKDGRSCTALEFTTLHMYCKLENYFSSYNLEHQFHQKHYIRAMRRCISREVKLKIILVLLRPPIWTITLHCFHLARLVGQTSYRITDNLAPPACKQFSAPQLSVSTSGSNRFYTQQRAGA